MMTIQELGSLGELVAAIATVLTLIYLAIQLRQNTKALRSQTFQQISAQMGQNAEIITTNPELPDIFVKALSGAEELTATERVRLQGMFVMSMRRVEAVYVHRQLGSIDDELADGFELSLLPLLTTSEGTEWWKTAKTTFHKSFVAHVQRRFENGEIPSRMPSISIGEPKDAA